MSGRRNSKSRDVSRYKKLSSKATNGVARSFQSHRWTTSRSRTSLIERSDSAESKV